MHADECVYFFYRAEEEAFEALSLVIILRLWRVVRIVNGESKVAISIVHSRNYSVKKEIR